MADGGWRAHYEPGLSCATPEIVVGECFFLLLGVGFRANGGVRAETAEPRPCDGPAAFMRWPGPAH